MVLLKRKFSWFVLFLFVFLLFSSMGVYAKGPTVFGDLNRSNLSKETLWEKFVKLNKDIQQTVGAYLKKMQGDFGITQNTLLLFAFPLKVRYDKGEALFAFSVQKKGWLSIRLRRFVDQGYLIKQKGDRYSITKTGKQYFKDLSKEKILKLGRSGLLLGLSRYADLIVVPKLVDGAQYWRLYNYRFADELKQLVAEGKIIKQPVALTGKHLYIVSQKGKKVLAAWSSRSRIWVLLLILLLSVVYGFVHSSGPGHGKVLVASYLLDHGKRVRDAIKMSFLVSLSHTGSAFVLATLFQIILSSAPDPVTRQTINAGFSVGSGLLIILIGGFELFRKLFSKKSPDNQEKKEARSLTVVSIAAGIIPCPLSMFIMALAVSLGIYYVGVISILGMSLGMFLLLFIVGLIAIKSRSGIEKKLSHTSKAGKVLRRVIEVGSSVAIILFGFLVMAGGL